jgi:hypothetical protein
VSGSYNRIMARGWQSNAAEGPVETRKVGRDARKPRTPVQLEQLRKTEDLQLSRTRVLHDIEASHNPRYTQMLTQALAHLDQELSRLVT